MNNHPFILIRDVYARLLAGVVSGEELYTTWDHVTAYVDDLYGERS